MLDIFQVFETYNFDLVSDVKCFGILKLFDATKTFEWFLIVSQLAKQNTSCRNGLTT